MGREEHKIKKIEKNITSDVAAIKCPTCNASVNIAQLGSDGFTNCSYCGTSLKINIIPLIKKYDFNEMLAKNKKLIQKYEPDETKAPSMEKIDNGTRQKQTIVEVKKNAKKGKLSDRAKLDLFALGSAAFFGVIAYITYAVEFGSYGLRFIIFLASIGLSIESLSPIFEDNEDMFDDQGNYKKGRES